MPTQKQTTRSGSAEELGRDIDEEVSRQMTSQPDRLLYDGHPSLPREEAPRIGDKAQVSAKHLADTEDNSQKASWPMEALLQIAWTHRAADLEAFGEILDTLEDVRKALLA